MGMSGNIQICSVALLLVGFFALHTDALDCVQCTYYTTVSNGVIVDFFSNTQDAECRQTPSLYNSVTCDPPQSDEVVRCYKEDVVFTGIYAASGENGVSTLGSRGCGYYKKSELEPPGCAYGGDIARYYPHVTIGFRPGYKVKGAGCACTDNNCNSATSVKSAGLVVLCVIAIVLSLVKYI